MTSPHLSLLGLRRNPFPLTPDAQSYFYTQQLENELAEVEHCIKSGKGFILVTGEVGLGKSTFVRRLLDMLESGDAQADAQSIAQPGPQVALVLNTFLQGRELLSAINHDFGIPVQSSMALDMAALNAFLLQQSSEGRQCLLIIDDAQNLTRESLELVRLLCNLESGQEKLLQIVLAGQPELLTTLSQENLRQLKSRIAKHVHLEGLSAADVARYFEFRITKAGGAGHLKLENAACKLLYRASQGNPRRIHLILDRCLYGLVARRSQRINKTLVKEAIADIQVGRPPTDQRRAAYRPGALLLTLGLPLAAIAGWGGHYLNTPTSQPAPVTSTGLTTVMAPPAIPLASSPTLPQPTIQSPQPLIPPQQATCLQKMSSASAQHGPAMRSLPLPAGLKAHLHQDSDLCIYQLESATETATDWVIWQPTLSSADLLAAPPNEAVRHLQSTLVQRGLLEADDIDGRFGPLTRAAIARQQQQHGLPATGEPDDLTLLLLEKYDERLSSAAR